VHHEVGTGYGFRTGVVLADVGTGDAETLPLFRCNRLLHEIEIVLVAGREVVDPGDVLVETEQFTDDVRPYESCNP